MDLDIPICDNLIYPSLYGLICDNLIYPSFYGLDIPICDNLIYPSFYGLRYSYISENVFFYILLSLAFQSYIIKTISNVLFPNCFIARLHITLS